MKPHLENNRLFWFSTAVLIVLVVASVWAHFTHPSDELTGPIAVLNHFFDLILAVGLSVLVLLVGYSIFKWSKVEFANSAEAIAFSFFTGTGTLGLAVLGLGLAGLLRPLPVSALIAFSLAITARQASAVFGSLRSGFRTAMHNSETQILFALFILLIGVFILRAGTLRWSSDELIYHLPVPAHFVQAGRVYPMFDNSLGNMPSLIHMIYALCLLAGSDIAARIFSLFLAVATALSIYSFCVRFISQRVGVLAMFAFFAAGMVVEVAVTTRIDVALAGMLFLSTYAMFIYVSDSNQSLRWLWFSAMFAGFSLGIKHSAALWILLLGVVYLVERGIVKRERIAKVFAHGLIFVSVMLTIASPWYLKNYLWFHNPFYPVFTGEVASYGAQGIRYFNTEDEQRLDNFFLEAQQRIPQTVQAEGEELQKYITKRVERHPLRLWEFFTKPNSYLMSEDFHYPNYLFLIVPLVFFCRRNKWIVWALVICFSFVLIMASKSWMARFLLPAYPLLTIVAAYTLIALTKVTWASRFFTQRSIMVATAVALSVPLGVSIASMRYFNSFRYLSGNLSRHQFLRQLSYYRAIDFINTELPPDAKVFIVGAQLNYGIQREYLSDETWFATKWRRELVRNDSYEGVYRDLKRQGFTHVFYSPGIFRYAAFTGLKGAGGMILISQTSQGNSEEARRFGSDFYLLRNWATFSLFSNEYLEPVFMDQQDRQILRIK